MSEPMKAQCCDFGRSCIEWDGHVWRIEVAEKLGTLGRHYIGIDRCPNRDCGTKLEKPLPPVTGLTEEEKDVLHAYAQNFTMFKEGVWVSVKGPLPKVIRSILSRCKE